MVLPRRLSPGAREPSPFVTPLASLLSLGPREKIAFSVQLASAASVLKRRRAALGLWLVFKVTSADELGA